MILLVSIVLRANSADFPALGVNLVDQGAFVNIVNHTARYNNSEGFDEYGWPSSDFSLVLMDHRPVAEWNGVIDDPEEYRVDYSGTYKCSFSGYADISLYGSNATIENKHYDETSNTTYFDLVIPGPPGPGHGFVNLTFTNTQRSPEGHTNAGISRLRVIRPGYDINTTQVFTDEYINLCKAADFACYRFYNVQNIWGGEPVYPAKTSWDQRKTPLDASQQPMDILNGKRDGWCWEYIIRLANILKKDIWINIHISCDSNNVLNLAKMLKDSLDPSINIYVENSNEVWSPTQLTHGPYNKAQADAYGISFDANYARRTVELSDLFARVFGKDQINKRIRVILAGQHAYAGRHDLHLDYISKKIGPPKEYIYALSTALYFGSTNPGGSVEDINLGMSEDIANQINNSSSNVYRKVHIDKAAEWGLPGGCTSYEGGPGIPSGGGTDNLANQINAHRTPEMKDILKKNYEEGWFDIGGGLALQFTLSSGYNRYGCWGLTDDYTKPDRNYKMQAMREIAGKWQAVPANSEPVVVDDLFCFPNPADGMIHLKFCLEKPAYIRFEIYNGIGTKIKEKNLYSFANGEIIINYSVSALPEGVYYIKLLAGGFLSCGNFIIMR